MWWRRELELGDTGPDVDVLQRKLRCVSRGVYDAETQARVRALQKRLGRPVTGRLDQETAQGLGDLPTASQAPSWYVRNLVLGDEGEDVAELRRMLGLSPSQKFTETVEMAVRRFQSGLGIPPDGVVGADVAIALGDDVPLTQT
jgi:peptidoglycan hydrolase-like protein with peptidoglycan-binding domain